MFNSNNKVLSKNIRKVIIKYFPKTHIVESLKHSSTLLPLL